MKALNLATSLPTRYKKLHLGGCAVGSTVFRWNERTPA